jgi:hypothetical protein
VIQTGLRIAQYTIRVYFLLYFAYAPVYHCKKYKKNIFLLGFFGPLLNCSSFCTTTKIRRFTEEKKREKDRNLHTSFLCKPTLNGIKNFENIFPVSSCQKIIRGVPLSFRCDFKTQPFTCSDAYFNPHDKK